MGECGAGPDCDRRVMTDGGATARATAATGGAPPKPPALATVSWTHGQAFEATAAGGRSFALDGDSVAGQSPPEALLSALAACTGVDIIEILKKRRTPAGRLEMRVTGHRASAMPPRFVAIAIEYHLDGARIERVHAERAIDLAVNSYCTVKDSLAKDIRFTWRLVLNGDAGADHDASAVAAVAAVAPATHIG